MNIFILYSITDETRCKEDGVLISILPYMYLIASSETDCMNHYGWRLSTLTL